MRRWRLAVFAKDAELGAVNVERMQHHVALAGDDPAFILSSGGGKHRHIHVEGFAVDAVGVMEIKPLTRRHTMIHAGPVVHVAHVAVVHTPHVAHPAVPHHAVIHSGHRLIAIFLHQRLHAHPVKHRIHRQLELTLRQPRQGR